MDSAAVNWGKEISHNQGALARWLRDLLRQLDPALVGGCSKAEQVTVAQALLNDPRYGGLLNTDSAAFKALDQWEGHWHEDLAFDGDALSHRPSLTLPLLLRELAQCAGLDGFDPVGSVPHQADAITGWLKALTAEGCLAYRREREADLPLPADWVPRRSGAAGGAALAQAEGVEVPIFFVGSGEGLNGWLRLWLWPCPGAGLTPLPSVVQRGLPLARSWVDGQAQAREWLLLQMQGQGGPWRDHALVWEVRTPDHAHTLLEGPSASAAFALASLWLLRAWAPPRWQAPLCSLTLQDWRRTHITGAIRAVGEATESDLAPVGGAGEKSAAQWVLVQGDASLRPPLHVARDQVLSQVDPSKPPPWLHRHANAFSVVQVLGRRALNLTEAQGRLLAWLQPHLHCFGPLEHAHSSSSWHLPLLDQLPLATDDRDGWASTLDDIAQDAQSPAHLVSFALNRWAARAHEQHEGGQVQSLFVNLVVSDEDRPKAELGEGVTASTSTAASPETYTLGQLLAAYEPDPQRPTQQIQALQIVGEPGAGKTWLLARFEQACAERLLWQQERRSSQTAPTDAAEAERDPHPFDDVPLYASLSELPAEVAGDQALADWFRTKVLGAPVADAPESRLRQRLLHPRSDTRLRLRLMLDGLNELKVPPGQTREERARQVVYALWRELKPGLPMLLGTRTHHRFDFTKNWGSGQTFRAATATLQRWSVAQMVGYLRQRWAHCPHQPLLAEVDRIEAQLRERERLRQVLGLPLYWRIQCELLEAGAQELLDSRARLLAALLWRNLHHEFTLHADKGEGRGDLALITEQERALAAEFLRAPDRAPPAFPRKGRLLQGLFALAWALWLAHPEASVEERGRVALPLEAEHAPPGQAAASALSVRGCLRGLNWPVASDAQREQYISDWINAAQDLGWLTLDRKSQTARFAHQAYGEFLASQQLFWKPRHAARQKHPQPSDWTADELTELAQQLAPAPLPRGCLQELDKQAQDADALWEEANLGALFQTWYTDGISADWGEVKAQLPDRILRDQAGSSRHYWRDRGVLEESSDKVTWHFANFGNHCERNGLFLRLDPVRHWHQQVGAWRYMLTVKTTWSIFRKKAQEQVAGHLGKEQGFEWAERMWQTTGQLPEAPPGALDEIVLLALEALQDPLPWLQALLNAARRVTFGDECGGAQPLTGCWALLSLCLRQESDRLDALHPASSMVARLRRESASLLLAVNQSADPELEGTAEHDIEGVPPAPAHDLRHRIQAGLCLGRQGALGTDAGDHLRFERVAFQLDNGRDAHGVRLKPAHWCVVHPLQSEVKPFMVARYPVTVGEFRAFVEAGGYHDDKAEWWLQGHGSEESAARAWLLREYGAIDAVERRPNLWRERRFQNVCLPAVGLSLYEAVAYARWACPLFDADWLSAQAKTLGLAELVLRLPTEAEWRAALRDIPDGAWPGQKAKNAPTPLAFNHYATGWGSTTPVGSFPSSRSLLGLMDAAGNQWEWCINDAADETHLDCPTSLENDQRLRPLRGGCCLSAVSRCQVSHRHRKAPDLFGNLSGFRLVLAVAL